MLKKQSVNSTSTINTTPTQTLPQFKQLSMAYQVRLPSYHPHLSHPPPPQTLSDPTLRTKYNEFGSRASQPEGGFMDPEEFFSQLFGGEKFVPIIGNISLGRDMKTAMQEGEDGEGEGGEGAEGRKRVKGKGAADLTPAERAKREEKSKKEAQEVRLTIVFDACLTVSMQKAAAREERVRKLAEELERKLSIFTESATGVDDVDVTRSWRTICELDAE